MDNFLAMFEDTSLLNLNLVIFSFFVGAVFAGIATVYHRRTIGRLVRYLLEKQAHSPETAKTLRDAEEDLNIFVRTSIRRNPAFRRIVTEVPLPEGGNAKRGLSDTPLYIPPEAKQRAEEMYSERQAEGANMWMVLVCIVLFGIIAYASTFIIPYLIQFANGVFG